MNSVIMNNTNGKQVASELQTFEVEPNRQHVSMRGSTYERTPECDSFESKNKSKTIKTIGIIATSLAILAGIGTVFVTHRGKNVLNKADATFKEKFEAGWNDIFKSTKKTAEKDSIKAADTSKKAAEKTNHFENIEINTEFVNDIDLIEVAKNSSIKILGSKYVIGSGNTSVNVFLRNYRNNLYKQYLSRLSKCKNIEELKAVIEQIFKVPKSATLEEFKSTLTEIKNAEKTIINPKALDFTKDSRINLDEIIANANKDETFLNKINITQNATPQEKMSMLLAEDILLAKKDLAMTIGFNGADLYINLPQSEQKIYNDIMEIIKSRLEFLS